MTGQSFISSESANSTSDGISGSATDEANNSSQSPQGNVHFSSSSGYELSLNILHADWEKMHTQVLDNFNQLQHINQKDPTTGDNLFKEYCCKVGDVLKFKKSKSSLLYERAKAFEKLLIALHEADQSTNKTKYNTLHKGLMYHYLAQFNYKLQNYDACLYHFDNAIAEDLIAYDDGWTNEGAALFLKLDIEAARRKKLVTCDLIEATRTSIEKAIQDYKTLINAVVSVRREDTNVPVDIDIFSEALFKLMNKPNQLGQAGRPYSSLVAAIYVFCLEHERKKEELKLRPGSGGSIANFIVHLLRGCVCFESIVRYFYEEKALQEQNTQKATGKNRDTYTILDRILKSDVFNRDFNLFDNDKNTKGIFGNSSLKDVIDLLDPQQNQDCDTTSIRCKFIVAAKLRNTIAHKLTWTDDNLNEKSLDDLYNAVIAAIIHVLMHEKPNLNQSN